ncbi:MAG: MFS transporter, partial [Saprospiraceae bacterium]|nr:MFS transporter [Saprospiraceae bacterium]
YRNLLVACCFLIIMGLEGLAFTQNLGMLQLSFLLIGFGGGMINGATNALVADISDAQVEERSANLSFLGIFFGIGALGMPALMALLSSVMAYDQILKWMGFAVVAPLLYFLFLSYPQSKVKTIDYHRNLSLVKDYSLWILGLFLFFQSALEGVTNNWITSFLQADDKMSSSAALLTLSSFVLSLTIGRIFLSGLLRKIAPLKVLSLSAFILLGGSFVLSTTTDPLLLRSGIILLGLGSAAGFPVILGFAAQVHDEIRGAAFSFVFVIALIGNILANYLTGLISDQFGMFVIPWILVASAVGVLVIALFPLRSEMKHFD